MHSEELQYTGPTDVIDLVPSSDGNRFALSGSPLAHMLKFKAFAGIIRALPPPRFGIYFGDNLERVLQALMERLAQERPTRYLDFILGTPHGRERAKEYLAKFAQGLTGAPDAFMEDQVNVGFVRARQGFQLEDVFQFTLTFKEVLWQFISEYQDEAPPESCKTAVDDTFYVHQLIDYSYILLCESFLKTRDELIVQRNHQLQSLHNYAASIIAEQDEERILAKAVEAVPSVVGLHAFFVVGEAEGEEDELATCRLLGEVKDKGPINEILPEILGAQEFSGRVEDGRLISMADAVMEGPFSLLVLPLWFRGLWAKYRLVLHRDGRRFHLDEYGKGLLHQFGHFTAGVLLDAQVLHEIAEKKDELRTLAGKLISFREEERKRLAADIHDTLTQALTGIGYKALLCQDLLEQDPGRLSAELAELTRQVNDGLRQSRQIIGDLRPSLLDVVGIVAAVKKLVAQFAYDTGIRASFDSANDIAVPPEMGIAAYRVVQESLVNIKKHAGVCTVRVRLRIRDSGNLALTVEDDGRGFTKHRQGRTHGLGLLIMRERAEELGGTFTVTSRPAQGCRIQVTLPLSQEGDHA